MDSIQLQKEIEDIHLALDTPQTIEQIQKAIVDECVSVQDVVRYAVTCFASHQIYVGHGTDNYWDEAIEIVQAVMHLQPPCDESTLSSKLTYAEKMLIAKILSLRIFERIPTPYLTHRAFFCGHEFYVDNRVIVPRSPIAELIEKGFDPYIERVPQRVLDMCTGSGCIAIAIALAFDGETQVDAVDISTDALDVVNINIDAYGLHDLVIPMQSDLFDSLVKNDKYDLIVANPPYVDAYDLETMPEEYHKEPSISLGSGEDGLDLAKRILCQASDFLEDDGVLIMEVGNSEEHLVNAFPQVPFHFIDLKKGGRGVFMLTCDQLKAYHDVFVQGSK